MAVTGAGLEGVVAAESRICYIDGGAGILSYQGYNIHTLAENATFEEVVYLLWHGRLPKRSELDALKAALVENRPIPAEVAAFLKNVSRALPMDVLRTAVSMLASGKGRRSPPASTTSARLPSAASFRSSCRRMWLSGSASTSSATESG